MAAALEARSLNHWAAHLLFYVHELLEGTSSFSVILKVPNTGFVITNAC